LEFRKKPLPGMAAT
jgi:hypothetical protein